MIIGIDGIVGIVGIVGIDMINSFGTTKIFTKLTTESKKVKAMTLFPTLALPQGFHGAMIFFRDSDKPGDITSIQTYSQFARYHKEEAISKEVSTDDSCLDVNSKRTKCLKMKLELTNMFVAMSGLKSIGLRSEICVCVSSLTKSGIETAIKKSLQFYSESVVPFETDSLPLSFGLNPLHTNPY